ncbi:MAG: hypothetical protein FWD23_01560 [Oscillospiraceae bacterium]|nr:hypothetical protein [Oscillospiraceae bacterium]
MVKLYIDVIIQVDKNGKIDPKYIKAGYEGEWIKVKAKKRNSMASLQLGAVGVRYTCDIVYNEIPREIYLFGEEDGRWCIEANDGN